jgi:DNA-binding IclR family transcriptional regulator
LHYVYETDLDMPPSSRSPLRLIQSVDRALTLLEAIAAGKEPANGPDLARAAGVNRSTAWRLLATLEHHQLIDRDPRTGHYTIGLGVAKLAAHVDHAGLVRRARPILERLAEESGESTALSVPHGTNVLVVDQVTAPHMVIVQFVGREAPLHCTSAGKLLLASFSDEEVDAVLAGPLRASTDKTITDPAKIRSEVQRVRKTGIATNFGEYELGANGFSAAARDASGLPFAFIGVMAPEFRLPASRVEELAPALLAAAAELSEVVAGDSSDQAEA